MPLKKIPPGVSPGGAKSVASSLSEETTKDLQLLIQNSIKEAMKPFVDQIKDLNTKLENCQQQVKAVEQRSQKLEMASEEAKLKIDQVQKKTTAMNKKQEVLECQLISLQLDRAASVLRFHNIEETDKEDLKAIMAKLLAPMVNLSQEEFRNEIVTVFRTTSMFIKQHKLPREVQLRLSTKRLRDAVLRATNEKQLTLGDSKIKVLREVPYLARQKRKKYKELAKLLLQNKINYTWLIEGLKFMFRGEIVKITSEFKMQEFLRRFGGELGKEVVVSAGGDVEEGEEESSDSVEEEEEEEEEKQKIAAAMAAKIKKSDIRRHFLRDRDK